MSASISNWRPGCLLWVTSRNLLMQLISHRHLKNELRHQARHGLAQLHPQWRGHSKQHEPVASWTPSQYSGNLFCRQCIGRRHPLLQWTRVWASTSKRFLPDVSAKLKPAPMVDVTQFPNYTSDSAWPGWPCEKARIPNDVMPAALIAAQAPTLRLMSLHLWSNCAVESIKDAIVIVVGAMKKQKWLRFIS